MTGTYGKKKRRQFNILFTFVASILICSIFLSVVGFFYREAEDEAYEMLHIQTKQIKDDLTLQIKSDRENLVTMAHFASKLYSDGENYDIMFSSFKPIGLFSNIGILTPENVFVTKNGSIDLTGKISFSDEVLRGEYISGRVLDLTGSGDEIIRSAVPIRVNNQTVGILYGVIKLDTINEKYNKMAQELDAQLFVYDIQSGNYVINTAEGPKGNVSSLKTRTYNKGYTYEDLTGTPSGYSSFKSIRTGEDLYIHHSTIDDIGWKILLARYESQVFAKTHVISGLLMGSFLFMLVIIMVYITYLMRSERRNSLVLSYASEIRKHLLEITQFGDNISESLENLASFSSSRSAFTFESDGEEYHHITQEGISDQLSNEERIQFASELFGYAAQANKIKNTTVGLICIKKDAHLLKTNAEFYNLLDAHNINKTYFAFVAHKNNRMSIVGVINPKKNYITKILLEDIAVCFSIAVYNIKHLNKTETAATTDSLTGAMNRVAYKRDIILFDRDKPTDFSCIYIDVNELHTRNNKYGHASGDEMLIYIANTLKETFYGQKIYRMGGDEFLVFVQNAEHDKVQKSIDLFIDDLKPMGYNVAIGMSFRKRNVNCEEIVREAEVRMYEAKAQYYQNKEKISISKNEDKNYIQIKTGITEIDTMISILKDHYNGIYKVSLKTDSAHRILMPSYLGYNEVEEHFSDLLAKYISDSVHPDFQRAMSTFLNYEAIKNHLSEDTTPRITYKKINGEMVILSVYKLGDKPNKVWDTLWVFAKS